MSNEEEKKKRKPQRVYPIHSLEDALIIPKAIQDKNNGLPFKRILLADSIKRKPTSSEFRNLQSSSYKYGLTLGTEKAEDISLTELGRAIVKPRNSVEKEKGMIEAALKPDLFRKIYEHYRNGKLPHGQFFKNVLEMDFGVQHEHSEEVANLIMKNGRFVNIVRDVSGSPYVLIEIEKLGEVAAPIGGEIEAEEPEGKIPSEEEAPGKPKEEEVRIFISHSKNKHILGQVKTMLEFGGYKYEVAEETETTAIPVPQKIIEAMRRCNSAIINVSADEQEKLEDGQYGINQNVLIEIGVASVLYDKKVVLLVDKRINLPSNLQGLYKCEYKGDELSWEAGLKLQKTITQFRSS